MLLLLLPAALLLSPGARAGGIVGGREAKPHSRPYMALVRIRPWLEPASTCSGFLFRPDVVVTAAHCRLKWSRGKVLLGAHNISKREQSWQKIGVRRWIPHPFYDKSNLKNDIMLLQLWREAELTAQVQPLPLPQPWPPAPVGSRCSVAGWGRTQAHPPRSSAVLREVQLEVLSNDECRRRRRKPYDAASMLCAGDPRGRGASLTGDSGGPLVCSGVPQGLVSWGPADGTSPEVYTRISRFLPWIRRELAQLEPVPGPVPHPRGQGNTRSVTRRR